MATSKTYDERHASAAETFECFEPGVEPERTAVTFGRRQGALGSMAFDVVGAMWSRPQLSRRDRSLLVIAILAAQAHDEELELHTACGLRHGLAPDEIEEILLHVAAYAGFPAAMASSRRIDKVLLAASGAEALPARVPAARKSDEERDRAGADVLAAMAGWRGRLNPAVGLEGMERVLGEVGVLAYRWDFGEIWCRPQLCRRDRSIVVIALLASLDAVTELDVQVPAAVRYGLTRVEIEEVVNHLSLYAGLPRAVVAMRAVRAAFNKLDAA